MVCTKCLYCYLFYYFKYFTIQFLLITWMYVIDKMVGSRFHIVVAIMLVTSMGYYIFHCFRENQRMVYELTGLKLKFKRSMVVSTKYEKNYKTSRNNEQLFAQSNRDLQMNLAKQEKELVASSVLLDKEKTKLGEAYLFYTYMKDMLDVTGQASNSPEKKVDTIVINSMKEKLSLWKSAGVNHKLLKKNHTLLLKKHTELNAALENLHKSNRKLRKVNVKNFNEYSKLKGMYDKLLMKYKNVTSMYSMQVAIDTKLQKELNNYKTSPQKISKVKSNRYGSTSTKVKGAKETTDLKSQVGKDQHNFSGNRNKGKKIEDIPKLPQQSMLNKIVSGSAKYNASAVANQNIHVASVVRSYRPGENIKSENHRNLSTRIEMFTHKKNITTIYNKMKSYLVKSSHPTRSLLGERHKNSKFIYSPTKQAVRLTEASKLSENKTKNAHTTTSTLTYTGKLKSTNHTDVATHTKPLDEYLQKEEKSHGKLGKDFDEERKVDPPHINDVTDEYGLSLKATAD